MGRSSDGGRGRTAAGRQARPAGKASRAADEPALSDESARPDDPRLPEATAAEDFRLIFERAGIGLCKTSPEGRYLLVNPAMAELFGYDSPAQMVAEVDDIGRRCYADPAVRGEMRARLEAGGEVVGLVSRGCRRDGGVFWMRESTRAVRDAEGRPLFFVGTVDRVDAQMEALDALRAAEQGYRDLFENATEGIYRSSIEGRMLRANPALVRLNGYDSEAELLAAVEDIAREWYVDPGRRAEFQRRLLAEERLEGFVSEVRRHRTGERIWITENARLVRDEAEGRPLYYEGSVREITQEVEARAELVRAQQAAEAGSRAKSAFLANMSHELRTPLNAIIGFAEVMLARLYGPIDNPRYAAYVEDIRRSGRLLLQLLDDILDLSKVEAGRPELQEETVDLERLFRESLRMLQPRAEAAGVALFLELPADLPRLRGDQRRLRQVALNLLSNALKYNRPGGSVTVRAERAADGDLLLLVEDSGLGIPEADLERVFQPFVQLGNGPGGGPGEGVGLGLPLSRQLATLHGGGLTLERRAEGGTRARLRLPAARCL